MKIGLLWLSIGVIFPVFGQKTIVVQPTFQTEKIILEKPFQYQQDSLVIHQLKWYLQGFTFYQDDHICYEAPDSVFLIDLADSITMRLAFLNCPNVALSTLHTQLGIDSVTNVSGALGGDLDPMLGMFWTWQSGYIHLKIEGTNLTSGIPFSYHIGGYASPNQTYQPITVSPINDCLFFDVEPLIRFAFQEQRYQLMSPSAIAVKFAQIAAQSFK
jgi:hypothetical protein